MILYKLQCCDEHSFEGWFRDSATYDQQVKSGDIECPYCGNTEITKAPMAPNIATGSNAKTPDNSPGDDKDTLDEYSGLSIPEVRAQQVAQKILDAATQAREYVENNFEDVGDDFADEARAMHYGDREENGIYGNATDTEEKELEDEGIDFVRIPGNERKNN